MTIDATPVDPHIQTLRDLLRGEHARRIAMWQKFADGSAEVGDLKRQQKYLEEVERLKAMPYPWEKAA
jgi:hypothetical protein